MFENLPTRKWLEHTCTRTRGKGASTKNAACTGGAGESFIYSAYNTMHHTRKNETNAAPPVQDETTNDARVTPLALPAAALFGRVRGDESKNRRRTRDQPTDMMYRVAR